MSNNIFRSPQLWLMNVAIIIKLKKLKAKL